MDKEYGRQRNQIWHGVKIKYERDDVDDNDDGNTDINTNELV
jgi:hypothetical protein